MTDESVEDEEALEQHRLRMARLQPSLLRRALTWLNTPLELKPYELAFVFFLGTALFDILKSGLW